MPAMTVRTVLVTGVSGYIGGTVLAAILSQQKDDAKLQISALVRNKSQAEAMVRMGVDPVEFTTFDDTATLEAIAKDFDVVIHTAAGWHTASAEAFIAGLGHHRESTGEAAHYLHISGTSNISDRPHSQGYTESRTLSDEEDVYSYEKYRESFERYPQRTTDIAVVEKGEICGVSTYIVMAPTIFGLGLGSFNRYSIQLPAMIGAALERSQVIVAGEGQTVWNHVHIQDLANLFVLLLHKISTSKPAPSGRKGIYFCESGQHTHLEFAERLAEVCFDLGIIKSRDVSHVSLQEAADQLAMGVLERAELSFAANARCKAVLARKLGWNPTMEDSWSTTFETEIHAMRQSPPQPREVPKYLKDQANKNRAK